MFLTENVELLLQKWSGFWGFNFESVIKVNQRQTRS